MELIPFGEKAIKLSERLGADESEVYITSTNGSHITFTDKIESASSFTTTGLGIRLVVDKRIGFYSTSSITNQDVEEAVRTALAIAKASNKNPEWVFFPTKTGKASVKGTFDEEIETMEPAMLVDASALILDGIHNYDKRLTLTRGSITIGTSETVVSNSYGNPLEKKETFASVVVDVKAEDGGKRGTSSEYCLVRNWKEIDFPTLFLPASERALKIMDAKSMAGERMPIVWRNTIFARIIGVMFAGTLSADSVQSKRSPWAGKLGKQIASSSINLFDDGLREAGVGTGEFDDEGTPQQMTHLINQGILKGYLYDNYTANKDKTASTGNAHRSYHEFPAPYPNNLTLKPTNIRPEELIEDTKRGLYVAETIGEWLSNPISGDLSATVTNGFLIEDGELTQPIKDVIVSGNFFNIINDKIDLVANDLRNFGSIYSPSVKVNTMILTENR